jgi:hypothetical protein
VTEDINESIVCSQCHGFRIWIHIKRTSVEGEPISYCKLSPLRVKTESLHRAELLLDSKLLGKS